MGAHRRDRVYAAQRAGFVARMVESLRLREDLVDLALLELEAATPIEQRTDSWWAEAESRAAATRSWTVVDVADLSDGQRALLLALMEARQRGTS